MKNTMLLGKELRDQLAIYPDYTSDIRSMSPAERLMKLQELYQLYIPSLMSEEIYCKLYTALLHSLKKKESPIVVKQRYENFRAVRQMNYHGIIGGSDSFTIIGESGIGKSTAISRAISIIEEQARIEEVIPFVVVQCPFDSSPKNLLLEILRIVDETLGSKYYENAKRARATTDMLIGSVSQIALSRIGVLIVDEIQNVVNSKNGRVLVGMLTQLINNSGISICMVGTPACTVFFEQEMQLARRSLGLSYRPMEYGDEFRSLCEELWRYQYVLDSADCDEEMKNWLYEHSRGNVSILVTLFHDAQEFAIMSGEDRFDVACLERVFRDRFALLHDFIRQEPVKLTSRQDKRKQEVREIRKTSVALPESNISLMETISIARDSGLDIIEALMAAVVVEEVTI